MDPAKVSATRKQIVELSKQWYEAENAPQSFRPGGDAVPVSGTSVTLETGLERTFGWYRDMQVQLRHQRQV